MRGEDILLFRLYYINQWLVLAFQMLGARILLVMATAGINGLEEKEDKGRMMQEGIFKLLGRRGTCWIEEDEREDTRQVLLIYTLDREG